MSKKYQAFPGMSDILPGEVEKWQWIEEKARILFEARGFREIRTPILEPTELFTRSIGEASDIVHKEMYTFNDRGERSMTMRPEMTASVGRAVIENGLLKTSKSLKLYYLGPMFRAERPQAGRKRQFHQIGVEMVNHSGVDADKEVIWRLYEFLKLTGLKNFKFKMNDLGESSQRASMIDGLKKYFSGHQDKLCKDCQWRLEKNVLRIFDCKIESCQAIIKQAPWENIAPLSAGFKSLCDDLSQRGVPVEVHRRLVRGLDYYTGTVFEVSAEGLGAQDAVAGGGRYDNLYEEIGGGQVPCTGFSIGFERLLMALEKSELPLSQRVREKLVYVAPVAGSEALDLYETVVNLTIQLREWGIHAVEGDLSAHLSDHLKKANKMNARYVVIVGPDELKQGYWTVKNMDEQKQDKVNKGELIFHLKGRPLV